MAQEHVSRFLYRKAVLCAAKRAQNCRQRLSAPRGPAILAQRGFEQKNKWVLPMALNFNKYRVHEVARTSVYPPGDHGNSDQVSHRAEEPYAGARRSADLSVIFEYMTASSGQNILESLLGAQQSERKNSLPRSREEKPAEKASGQTSASSKVKQVHRIDTRGTGDVNLAKYDDHVDKLVDAKAERMESRAPRRSSPRSPISAQAVSATSAVRRSRRRCAACSVSTRWQRSKKIPVRSKVPDEISVGELALPA